MYSTSDPPAIIDIEASGFGPDGYPIEIGVALSSGQTFCALILPEPEWQIHSPCTTPDHPPIS
jgi:hypothetical protein